MKHLIQSSTVIVAVFTLVSSMIVQSAEQNITSLQVPLAGTILVPLTDDSFDTVTLSGQVHVVADAQTSFPPTPIQPLRLLVNLDQVSGIGSVTKREFVATGSNRISLTDYPPTPIIFGFDLREVSYPPHPITPGKPLPLDIGFLFDFNTDTGELTGVSIDSMTMPAP